MNIKVQKLFYSPLAFLDMTASVLSDHWFLYARGMFNTVSFWELLGVRNQKLVDLFGSHQIVQFWLQEKVTSRKKKEGYALLNGGFIVSQLFTGEMFMMQEMYRLGRRGRKSVQVEDSLSERELPALLVIYWYVYTSIFQSLVHLTLHRLFCLEKDNWTKNCAFGGIKIDLINRSSHGF